ncbi:hypothetical protein EXN66_Car011013 [Channa argus]|uniref:Chemokine interleukin-8-like domain-containing protein n=1 Tax=Channa argus TaxID=215402 RepID=A0A6G1PYL5_CHAAH|nr:hypothetical protein EXN66_Car011013 [Channa argus]
MASRVAALLLLGFVCTGFVAAEVAVDCCLMVVDKHLPLQVLAGYTIQEAGKGCEISATVSVCSFISLLCFSPAFSGSSRSLEALDSPPSQTRVVLEEIRVVQEDHSGVIVFI